MDKKTEKTLEQKLKKAQEKIEEQNQIIENLKNLIEDLKIIITQMHLDELKAQRQNMSSIPNKQK